MITNISDLNASIAEAERFILRARECLLDLMAVQRRNSNRKPHEPKVYHDQRKTAAVRRASMDLTRSLIQLRKPY